MRLTLLLLLALPLAAQDLFPRFSVTGATAAANFDTNARIDPEVGEEEGTLVNFEDDLGLEESRTLQRFGVQWRPFRRHELAATMFSAPREGFAVISRDITFRNEVYRVNAVVTSELDFDYWDVTYTYWARRGESDGLGLSLGVANLEMNTSVTAVTPGGGGTATQTAETEVPVALVGAQGRFAFTRSLHGMASVSALPDVTIEQYTGRVLSGSARLEYRPIRWIGVGAAYQYFRLDVDVAESALTGSLDMTIQGPEAYLRLAF